LDGIPVYMELGPVVRYGDEYTTIGASLRQRDLLESLCRYELKADHGTWAVVGVSSFIEERDCPRKPEGVQSVGGRITTR
jgi:hypothetical protein